MHGIENSFLDIKIWRNCHKPYYSWKTIFVAESILKYIYGCVTINITEKVGTKDTVSFE